MPTKLILTIFLVLVFVTGCSESGAPHLIAAFPSGEARPPPAPPVEPRSQPQFVYHASLEIESWNPGLAANKAEELAARYAGYLVSSQACYEDWCQDGGGHITLVLAVPVYNFQALYGDLHSLGKVVSEQVWGQWQSFGPGGARYYSQITFEIAPRTIALPKILPGGWSPGRTLASALRVSAAIFRFLVDAAIWLLVLVAPFALIFLGLRSVIRRLRS